MENILFCMSLEYIRYKFYKNLKYRRLDISRIYMQWDSSIRYSRYVINNHVVGNAHVWNYQFYLYLFISRRWAFGIIPVMWMARG